MQDQPPSASTSFGLLILRVGAGGFMMIHGWGKVQMVIDGAFDKFADPIGLGTGVSLVLAALAEFFGSLLVVLGLATRLAAASVVFTRGVAAFVIHQSDPWTAGAAAKLFKAGQATSWSSKEPALLFLVAFLALVFTGAGQLSVDTWALGRKGKKK
jgi:putative oxidoreductase